MDSTFSQVFSPYRLGPIELKNRLVALPAGTSMVADGIPTDGDVEHFERLARGGVGLIVSGATVVHPTSTIRSRKLVEAYQADVVAPLAHKAEVVHRHGARLVGQLIHLGREFIGGESDFPPVAPSALKTVRDAYPPHPLTTEEIADIVEGWRVSAHHLLTAGFDGVELHAAHGYLIAQFMSPSTNRRTDEYGGSFENRMRHLHEIIAAIRSVRAEPFVLGVRLSAEEDLPDGMNLDDCVEIARDLATLGSVDYVSITHGTRGSYVKDSTHPDGVALASAARVREETGLTTLVGQRIRDVGMAEHAIKSGQADLVGMARALIADPELPNKSRAGRLGEVRGCLGVNQDCRAFDPHLHCAVNAEVGRTRPATVGVTVDSPKEVYVIGGGPAGLEAARVAGERGHRVTLFEQSTELGGAVRIAAAAPHRATLIDIVDYLSNEARRLRVDVNLGAAISVDDLLEIRSMADHVVLATGSLPSTGPTFGSIPTVTVDDAILGTSTPASPGYAVVYDDGDGFWPAYNAAEALARDGWTVDLATRLTALASRIPGESVGPLLRRLGGHGVRLQVGQTLGPGPSADTVLMSSVFGTGDEIVNPSMLVWHQPRRAVADLDLQASGDLDGLCPISTIGDAVTPRRIGHAIAEGYQVGATV